MPISDEVIELAPVKKAKKTLIILLVAVGISVALAVTFLVMYLLKPAPPPDSAVVYDVSITESSLFSCDGEYYASIGNEYTVGAHASIEDGTSSDIVWEVDDPSAVTIKSSGETFTFTPNAAADGKTVKITARSAAKTDKLDEVSVHIVNQAAESISLLKYFSSRDSANALTPVGDIVNIPYYTTRDDIYYTLTFIQNGKCDNVKNEETGEYGYLQITSIKNPDGSDPNVVTAVSSNSKIVEISGGRPATAETVYFYARGEGTATITLTARSGITKNITVNTTSSAKLGLIENIYVFDKAIVNFDDFKITDYLNAAQTELDDAKLNAAFGTANKNRTATMITKPSEDLVLPYTNSAYDDIFAHLLVKPYSIQFNPDGTLKSNWHKNVAVTTDHSDIVNVVTNNSGAVSLYTRGMLSSVGESCSLTFTDNAVGGLKASQKVSVRLVAGNNSGTFVAENKGENDIVDVASNAEVNAFVTYNLSMPGNVNEEEVVQNRNMSLSYKLDFRSDIFEISIGGKALKSGEVYEFEKTDLDIEKYGGGTSVGAYHAKATFRIKIKVDAPSTVKGEEPVVTFTKIGLSLSNGNDWEGVDKADAQWSKSVKFNITTSVHSANIIADDDAAAKEFIAKLTANGTRAGGFERTSDTAATVYVQQLNNGEPLPFDYTDLIDISGVYKSLTATVGSMNNVFTRAPENGIDKLTFNNNPFDEAKTPTQVKVTIVNLNDVTLAPISINIVVIDAISSVAEIAAKSETYNRATQDAKISGGTISLGTFITVGYVKRTGTTYNYNGVRIKLLNGEYLAESDGRFYYPDTDGTPLYSFSGGVLTPLCDLYEFSQEKEVDVSRVNVEFQLHSGDYNISGKTPSVRCTFMHQACDYVVTLTTPSGSNDLGVENNGSNKVFDRKINQGDRVTLTVKTKIMLSAGATLADEDIAAIAHAYITLPTEIVDNIVGNPEKDEKGYYDVTFDAPSTGGLEEKLFLTNVAYGSITPEKIHLIVQNKARKVKTISVYTTCTDNGGNKEYGGLLASGADIDFGKLNVSADNYRLKLYIKIEYSESTGNVSYFESVLLTLPEYITATKTSFVASDANLETVGYLEFFECTLELDRSKKDDYNINPTIKLKPSSTEIELTYRAVVKTGLDSITVDNTDISAGVVRTVTKNVQIASAADLDTVTSFTYPITFNPLGKDYGIVYDTKNLTVSNTTYTGIAYRFALADGTPRITFTIDPKALTQRINNVDVVFTDLISGSTFTVTFEINVTASVYKLALVGSDISEQGITIHTTGGSGAVAPINFTVSVNDGATNLAITDLSGINSYIAQSADGESFSGVGQNFEDIKVEPVTDSKVNYTLTVKNSVTSGDNYYLRANSGDVYAAAKKILIETSSHTLYLDNDNNSIKFEENSENNYTANVVISSAADNKFTLKGIVKNDGTNLLVADKTVSYSVQSGDGVASNDGVLTITPTAQSGAVVYKISYTDNGGSGKTFEITVTVNYTVKITSVALSGLGSEYKDGKIYLYYIDGTHRTYIDLSGKVAVSNTTFGSVTFTDPILGLSTSNGKVHIDGLKVYPRGNGDGEVTVTLSAQNGDTKAETLDVVFVLKEIPELSLAQTSGKIDILDENGSVTVAPKTAIANLTGLTYTYALGYANDSAKKSGLAFENSTVTLDGKSNASIGTYKILATVTYSLDADNKSSSENELTATATAEYVLTVECGYAPEFKMVYGTAANEVSTYDSAASVGAHVISDSDKNSYKLVLTNPSSVSGSSYAVAVKSGSDNVITVASTFTDNNCAVTLVDNASGKFTVVVTSTVYGVSRSVEQVYYFTYGENPTVTLTAKKGSQSVDISGGSINIDGTTATEKYTLEYAVSDVADNATVDISVFGVDSSAVSINGKTATVTLSDPTTVTIDAVVTVGNRKIYVERKTVSVTATAPNMSLTNTNDTIKPAENTTLGIADDATYKANYDVEYSIVSGAEYVNVVQSDKTYTVTAKNNVTSDQTVTVKAVVTITSGGYIGTTYTFYKDIKITGVALPTITLTCGESAVVTNGSVVLTYDVNVPNDVTLGNITGHSVGLSDGTGTVSVNTADKTVTVKLSNINVPVSGIEFGVKISALVTGDIHEGQTIESNTVKLLILPTATSTDGVSVPNGIGAYDMQNAAKPSFIGEGVMPDYEMLGISDVKLNGANSDKVSASGRMLLVNDVLTANDTVSFIATLRILNGAYAGYTVSGEASVTVDGATVDNITLAWDNAAHKYTSVKPNVNKTGVTKIEIINVDDKLIITDNGTSNAAISAISSCNIGDANKTVENVQFVITLGNGFVYYATANVTIAPVSPTVKVIYNDKEIEDALFDNKNVGDVFSVSVKEDNGFDVTVTSATSDDDCLTSTIGGSNVMFSVGNVTEGKNITVTLNINVGDKNIVKTFKVVINAPITSAAYMYDNTHVTDTDKNGNLTSTWTSYNDYKYAYSMVISIADGSLSDYLSSVAIVNASGSNIYTVSESSLNTSSVTLWFDKQSGNNHSHRYEFSEFKLKFVYKTIEDYDVSISAICTAYRSSSNYYQPQTVTATYRIRVVSQYNVTLNGNGGNIHGATSLTYTKGERLGSRLLDAAPTRTGYTFIGWNSDPNGSGTAYTSESTVNGNLTLYAQWQANTYTVTLMSDGVKFGEIKVVYDSTYGPLPTPTRSGYTFNGWKNGATVIKSTDTVKITSDSTFTADWTEITYKNVKFKTDDSASGTVVRYENNETYQVRLPNNPTKEGYIFLGWYNGDTAIDITAEAVDNAVFVAKWYKIPETTYTVTFDANNGEISGMSAMTATVNSGSSLANYSGLTPTRDGYEFKGWSTTADDTTTKVDIATTTVSGNITYYALWEEKTTTPETTDPVIPDTGDETETH